jgi:dihydroneopterin aldolase
MPSRLPSHNCSVDRIVLEGMTFSGRHGVRSAERARAQDFKVDVEVETDLVRPGKSDQVKDSVDYRLLRAIVKEVIEGESVSLIETLADRIADRVLKLPKVDTVSVRVAKQPASMMPIVSAAVHIKRTRA